MYLAISINEKRKFKAITLLLFPYGNICSLIRLFYKISYIFMIRRIVRKCAIPRIRPLATLPEEASIFFAELHAIHLARQYQTNCHLFRFTEFTSSNARWFDLSHYVTTIVHQLADMSEKHFSINFCWVPSHVGIMGIEEANIAANEAAGTGCLHYLDFEI